MSKEDHETTSTFSSVFFCFTKTPGSDDVWMHLLIVLDRHLSGKMAGQTSDWANRMHVFVQFLHPLLLVRGEKKDP